MYIVLFAEKDVSKPTLSVTGYVTNKNKGTVQDYKCTILPIGTCKMVSRFIFLWKSFTVCAHVP